VIVAVIAARNEEQTIQSLVERLFAHVDRVIVIDAESDDHTALRAFEAGAHVFPGSGGIGPCLVRGWQLALEAGASRIVQIDAGGSHDVADLPRLLACRADLVIGSRFVRGAVYHGRPWRALASRVASLACSYAQSGASWHDWTSGYRVFSARAARYLADVRYTATMHGWQIEVLARAGEAGIGIAEVPITYTAGASSFSPAVAHEAFMTWLHVMHHIGWVGSKLYEETA
jgi:dolichol-phosphate mannosyltransferase